MSGWSQSFGFLLASGAYRSAARNAPTPCGQGSQRKSRRRRPAGPGHLLRSLLGHAAGLCDSRQARREKRCRGIGAESPTPVWALEARAQTGGLDTRFARCSPMHPGDAKIYEISKPVNLRPLHMHVIKTAYLSLLVYIEHLQLFIQIVCAALWGLFCPHCYKYYGSRLRE